MWLLCQNESQALSIAHIKHAAMKEIDDPTATLQQPTATAQSTWSII